VESQDKTTSEINHCNGSIDTMPQTKVAWKHFTTNLVGKKVARSVVWWTITLSKIFGHFLCVYRNWPGFCSFAWLPLWLECQNWKGLRFSVLKSVCWQNKKVISKYWDTACLWQMFGTGLNTQFWTDICLLFCIIIWVWTHIFCMLW
jgi:hypothetical protein